MNRKTMPPRMGRGRTMGSSLYASRNYKNTRSDSQLLQYDQKTEDSYKNPMVNFDPKTTVDNYSFTSYRVAKTVYNTYYQDANKPKVFGYYTDWSQYDGRLADGANPLTDDPFNRATGFGRGRDAGLLDPVAYDRIVFGFLGIVGDQGEKSDRVNFAAEQYNKTTDEVLFIDPWGDIASGINTGIDPLEYQQANGWSIGGSQGPSYASVTNQKALDNKKGFGILRALYDKQKAAKEKSNTLELALSIGGWTLSGPFSGIAAAPARRQTFIDSICKLFDDFPMFTHADIDWEYPGIQGNPSNSEWDEINDGPNYARLIDEMRKTFDSRYKGSDKKYISIASSSDVTKLQLSNIKGLIDAGLHYINVMSYDFFGTPWAQHLGHHSNLMHYANNGEATSTDEAVGYLLSPEVGATSKQINIGWAAYSRNAQGAKLESQSPLKGTYTPISGKPCLGTLESGTSEWYDIMKNYIDLEGSGDINNYKLLTDAEANADYLYNESNGMFISLDTPRSCYAKGKYARDNNLGGVFEWVIDVDNGLLVNAVREGAGYEIETTAIDMNQFYFCGSNITEPGLCESLTMGEGGGGNINHRPTVTIDPPSVDMNEGEEVTLTATVTDPEGDAITSSWTSIPTGLTVISQTATTLKLLAEDVSGNKDFVVAFEASDGTNTVPKNVNIRVRDLNIGQPGSCRDPNADNIEPWDSTKTYGAANIEVSHKNLVWKSGYWTQGDEPEMPGIQGQAWILVTNVVKDWDSTLQYLEGSIVNHKDRMWKSSAWMDTNMEPGGTPGEWGAHWEDIGEAACTPPSRHGRKSNLRNLRYKK